MGIKDNKMILMQKFDPHNQKIKVSLATKFVEVASNGLLSEHPHLIVSLCA